MEVVKKLLSTKVDGYKFSISFGKLLILSGLSLITSLILTNYINNNIDDYVSFISKVDKKNLIILLLAYALIIYGIVIYKNTLFTIREITIKYYVEMVLKRSLPHLMILTLGILYVFDIEGVYDEISNNSNGILVVHTIAILIIFYEVIRIFQNLLSILNKTILDSKDRLTLAVTILATIVSAIALFK